MSGYEEEISKEPVSILFNPSAISKKDVWEVDLVKILDILIRILQKSGNRDLRVAGMAALSSSLIYRMKVESIFELQKAAMERKPLTQKRDINIRIIDMPYRHESTYPVTLDELLGMLNNLIGALANPKSGSRRQIVEPIEPPDLEDITISIEKFIEKYEGLIIRKISDAGYGLLGQIVAGLETIDAIRCFFAALFLARDGRVELEQTGDDITITMVGDGNQG